MIVSAIFEDISLLQQKLHSALGPTSQRSESLESPDSVEKVAASTVFWKQMLEAYEEPPMDEAVDEALKDYFTRCKHGLKDFQP